MLGCLKMDNHEKLDGVFFFDQEYRIYMDHFPSNPVVPGSVIVDAFIEACKRLGIKEDTFLIENFRFARFVSPGKYNFRIQEIKGGIGCTLYNKSQKVVTGKLRYET
jgi:3-hydroxyacyl-[acyl-carrier-protein] dehydratase